MFLRGRPVTIHAPDQQRDSFSLDQKVALPEKKLKLQWVYPSNRKGDDNHEQLYLQSKQWMRNIFKILKNI